MSVQSHFTLMSAYNRRMNHQIYEASLHLNKEELEKDLGAFFSSVIGTLNHILVGDLLWLSRFKNHSGEYLSLKIIDAYPKPKSLNEKLYSDFSELYMVRKNVDEAICQWVEETEESDFKNSLTYQDSKNITSTRNFGELVFHLFNHQTHHRGQVSTLLNQYGHNIGTTDFLIDIPEKSMAK